MDMWYVKLFRKLKENPIAYNLELLWLLSYILMDVNFKENTFYRWSKKIVVKPWEKIFSQRWYSERFWVSISKIHRYLKILSSEWILKHEWNSNFTLLKLNNWDSYNWTETQIETKQKPNRNQIETNKKEKNIKKDNNIINTNINKPAKVKTFEEDSFFYKTAKEFLNFHLENQTPSVIYQINNKWEEDILQQWADGVRKLHDLDKFNEKQIEFIFNFTKKNDFWSKQILSVSKFRKKNDDWVPYFVVMINEAKKTWESTLKPKKTITYG